MANQWTFLWAGPQFVDHQLEQWVRRNMLGEHRVRDDAPEGHMWILVRFDQAEILYRFLASQMVISSLLRIVKAKRLLGS